MQPGGTASSARAGKRSGQSSGSCFNIYYFCIVHPRLWHGRMAADHRKASPRSLKSVLGATYTTTAHHLTQVISCHAVAASGGLLALCPNSSEVVLLERSTAGQWQVVCRLEGHDQLVSGLDFFQDGQGGLRLVSSSHDRNSYVWTRQPGVPRGSSSSWSPELVITKLSRAGLCVRWSPCGRKFAIGSGEAAVCVCYWDGGKELWAPKLIKKQHTSSVTALAWHPSGSLLATGSTDRRCRLLNAAIPDVDGGTVAGAALGGTRFGELLGEAESSAWVLAVAWAPTGNTLAFCSQDSTLTILSALDLRDPASLSSAALAARRQQLQLPGLPLKCLTFLRDDVLVGGGFDFSPLVFQRWQTSGEWRLVSLEPGSGGGSNAGTSGGGPAGSSSLSARIKMFEAQAAKPHAHAAGSSRAGAGSRSSEQQQQQPHSNCIVCITPLGDAPNSLRFLTSGLDGRVVEWQLEGL